MESEKLDKALRRVKGHIRFLVEAGLGEDAEGAIGRVGVTADLEDALQGAEYVRESIYESYEVKMAVCREMDETAPRECILASSTSGLLMTEIQKAAGGLPEKVYRGPSLEPCPPNPLVEICPGELTSKETIYRTIDLMERIGKVPVVLRKEAPGVIGNRLSAALYVTVDIEDPFQFKNLIQGLCVEESCVIHSIREL